jgi:PAS domain-containing protein
MSRGKQWAEVAERLGGSDFVLSGLLESAPFAIEVFGTDGTCLGCNAAFRTMFGGLAEPSYNVMDHQRAQQIGATAAIRRAMDGATCHFSGAWHRSRRTGTVEAGAIAVETTLFPLRDSDGQVACIVAQFRDITKSVSREERYRLAVEAAPNAMIMIDAGRRIVLVNAHYQPLGISAFMVLAAEHSFFSGRSLWQLILGGVFDRFPALRIAFVETEAWWIAPMIGMLDKRERASDDWTEFAQSLGQSKPYSRLPSEYWRSNCYAGISPFHPSQIEASALGSADGDDEEFTLHSDNAMFGVDYPHPESIVPNVIDNARLLAAMPNVTEADARKVLFENAADVFHIDLAALQPHFDRVAFELDVPVGSPA